ncbi:MAG: 7-carboxy-7-deazaguanine synthase QueE [Polyangiaceae bacterium]|nr:7-carboxy-7-deazaguanine synthase QueE [Polyangiaceae bacterium]MCW5790099.1 7-carboxy-7-deazaguanine synthase QueE [Polyangiaceae bacterium]
MQLRVSEVFQSVQGEGVSLGEPCVFLRFALCNLRCSWCDTKYTWDFSQYRYEDEVKHWSLTETRAALERAGLTDTQRLVITGGEPLIQSAGIEALLAELPRAVVVEVETNGTFAPSVKLAARVDQWNVSPKLAHGGDPAHRRLRPEALAALMATGRAWLKLVVMDTDDTEELLELARGWPASRVLLMPQATSREELAERLPAVQALAAELGFNACTRLHIERWGGKRGV